MLTIGSLFSGIGGLDLGLERAGWEVKWQVEIDEWCRKVLAKHWPDVTKYRDVRELSGDDLDPVDLIAGGFPCQPFSHAGRREGKADNRYLWPEMLRVIREVRPPFVLAENVYGLVTGQQGLLLETVYLDLEAAGYEVAPPIVFPAASLGAPHRRDRVWVCAHARQYHRCAQQGEQQEAGAEGTDRLRPESREAMAHTQGLTRQDGQTETERQGRPASSGAVAHPTGGGRNPQSLQRSGPQARDSSFDADGSGTTIRGEDWWSVEPDVGRVAHGVPSRVDRLRGLGNAVVPQVAEWIGRKILEVR